MRRILSNNGERFCPRRLTRTSHFFQMHIEGSFVDRTKTDETGFRMTPESFNPVHMRTTSDQFILAVIDAELFALSHITPTVLASSPIRMDHTLPGIFSRTCRLHRRLSAVRDKCRVDLSIALKNPQDARLTVKSGLFDRASRVTSQTPTTSNKTQATSSQKTLFHFATWTFSFF